MKILLVITGLGLGGAEIQICNLADEFVKLGNEVQIISLTREIIIVPKNKNIKITNLNITKNIINLIAAYKKVQNILDTFKPDVVHSHLFHANIFMRLIRIKCKIPLLVCTAHNIIEKSLLRILAYRLTDKLSEIFTCVSQKVLQSFEESGAIKKSKLKVQYNGIDTNYFIFNEQSRICIREELGINKNTIVLLAVGRLTEVKDYPNLIKAFAKLQKKNIKLLIAGTGDKQCELKALANKLNINEQILFLGKRNDIPSLMSASDIFVLSSKEEGFGLVVAEAMSCERVVVATDCGGMKEVMGECGFLVKPSSEIDLLEGIKKALKESEQQKIQMGISARKRVIERFSLSQIAIYWLESIYSNFIAIPKV